MKKILLLMTLIGLVYSGISQTVLNETYSNPGPGNSEFIELYNSSTLGSQNLDCFTILTYWTNGLNGAAYRKGWYVLDLPNASVASKAWFVIAGSSPFSVQGTLGIIADVSFNSLAFRNGSTGGYLKKYAVSGGVYVDSMLNNTRSIVDLLGEGDFANGQNRLTLLFQNGQFINGFWGGGNTGTLPVGITGMPDLLVTPAGACITPFTIHFAQTPAPPVGTTNVTAVEFVNQSAGNDNGYARTSDGKCGSWDKTSNQLSHTPGATNGTAGATGAITSAQFVNCSVPRAVQFDITAISGTITLADDFPVTVQVYNDVNNNGVLDGTDIFIGSKNQASVVAPGDTVQLTGTNKNAISILVIYQTKRGCFDKIIRVISQCAPLPVDFKSFTATRNKANVMLKWTTASEKNNSGFAVERNIDNVNWEEVAFVRSQAPSGNSDLDLMYQYIDNNNSKGISQYRIRQVDFDSRSKFSEIRSVKGDGQIGAVIVYPNPSADGRINVVFDNATVVRNIVVMDMSGRTIKQIYSVSNNNITIDNLMPGMYSLRVFVPETGEQTVLKVIVSKR